MIELLAVAIAFCALGFTLLSLRHAQDKVAALEGDLDAIEGHNRTLQDQRDSLRANLAETTHALEEAKRRIEAVETEKKELETQRAELAESVSRLEKLRAELESDLAKLRRDHESLERRTLEFQGQWSHQLTTLEAEISTLIRQLGEFRKGTQLPIQKSDGGAPAAQPNAATPPAQDAGWALSAPVGPRLAASRPRVVGAETPAAEADPASARRAP
jgi:predicted RNase H-like nuclease (RuvC/YqgF family)